MAVDSPLRLLPPLGREERKTMGGGARGPNGKREENESIRLSATRRRVLLLLSGMRCRQEVSG